MIRTRAHRPRSALVTGTRWCVLAPALLALACNDPMPAARERRVAPAQDPVIHLHETHSSALIAWRQDRVENRVLVHIDAELDFDWLPDETIARIAAADTTELAHFEAQPFELADDELAGFGSFNFLYAAARLGIVREIVWVVPDATFEGDSARRRMVQEVLFGRLQRVGIDDAKSFRDDGTRIRGELLGVPLTICRLADLPPLADGVLLDVDVSYLTRRSSLEPGSDTVPWISTEDLDRRLGEARIRPDVVTVSLSTLDGATPPASRWIGRDLQERFRGAVPRDSGFVQRKRAEEAQRGGDPERASESFLDLAVARPDDATVWYSLAAVLRHAGKPSEADDAEARAERLDPLLIHAALLEAEQSWRRGDLAGALARYDAYLAHGTRDGFAPYAERQRALCLLAAGRRDEGIAALGRVVGAYPRYARGRFELGLALADAGQRQAATGHLIVARELSPNVASFGAALGSLYYDDNRTLEAIRELERAVELRPCSVQARARLVPALMRAGRRDDARKQLEAALTLQPDNPRLRAMAAGFFRGSVVTSVEP
jgi:tetratricopeptide (TPR) repeat protein